ncbi:hypothetical protein J2S16_001838 [Cytobacillus kochii]|nr:hypothetical protein [Cytobacillus kochii]
MEWVQDMLMFIADGDVRLQNNERAGKNYHPAH